MDVSGAPSGPLGTSSPAAAQPHPAVGIPTMLARQPLPKQLTAAIKSCTSVERLAQLTAEYQAVLNPIHIAAIVTKLPKLDASQNSAATALGTDVGWLPGAPAQQLQLRQLLQQLLSRLKAQGCSNHSPRGVANIVWALAKLQYAPDPDLRAMLLDTFCEQLSTAVPQDISNVLWGVAKLTKEHAQVLSAQQLPAGAVSATGSQDSSGTAGAAADNAGPLLQQQQVRLLLLQLCKQLHSASVQTISNSLWAVVVLQQEHQWCMCNCLTEVQTLLSVFCAQSQQAMPGHIQPIIRCMAQLATACSSHAGDSWLQWQPPLLQQLLEFLARQREQLEMHHVSSVLRDVAQIVCLQLQLQKQLRDKQQGGDRSALATSIGFSSASSLPSMGDAGGGAGLEGTSPQRTSAGLGGISACSSTASSSSMLGTSLATQSAPASTTSGDDVEDVLARLAASRGPQDASSTVLALAMLRPQLQQLGLQPGVAALCSMLPPAALPHLGPEVGQRLLAVASQQDTASACSPTTVPLTERASGRSEVADTPFSLPVSSTFAARVFAQSTEGLPLVPIPLAIAGSVSSSSSGSNVASPTDPSPLGCFGSSPTVGSFLRGGIELGGLAGSNLTAQGGVPGSNPGHGNPGSNPVSPQVAVNPGNPGNPHNPGTHAGSTVVPAGLSAEGEGDSQEEAAARQLTHNIAYADSVFQLADIFTAHASVMDMIHITACITRLSKVLGTSPSQASQAAAATLLPLLGNKLLSVLPNANARGIANVLWGYGRLRALPQTQLLPPLVEAFLTQLPNAACRDSAVVLWSLARLSEGHGEPPETTVPVSLLRRLGREVLQQLATAAQEAPAQAASQQQQQRQPSTPGTSTAAAADQTKSEGQEDVGGPPSSRDISNSLMALARLGFVPEDDSTTGGQQGADALAGQLQGLSLSAAGAGAADASKQLTLPLSVIKAVVDYLLQMAATAKTLDLQETATALKQLGLRELHAKVAATVITHHGTTHGAGGPGGQFMQLGGPGRSGTYHGRVMGPQGPIYGAGQYSSFIQQQRRQGMQAAGPMYGAGGWVSAHQQPQGQFEGGMMLRQVGPGGGYVPARQGPGQVMRALPNVAQQQQQQAYVLTSVGQPGGRQSMPGYTSLAAAAGGVAAVPYGGSPAAGAAPGYAVQYGAEQAQQQQPPGLLQPQAGGSYTPGVQYMLMPQQGQQGMGTYVMQPQAQQQGGEYVGMPVLQQQLAAEQAPPGLVGGAGAVSGSGQQYFLQAASSPAVIMPGMGVAQDTGGSGQQLFLQPAQQVQGAGAGLGGLGQFGSAGAGVYQASTGMMVPDTMSSQAYNASGVGDIFLGGQQQQPQSARSQLQMLQQQIGQPVLYQQAGAQAQSFQAQDPGAMYLQQPQQQPQQQLPMMYGVAGQQQAQQQQFAQAGGVGTFVLDPTTGMYHIQQ